MSLKLLSANHGAALAATLAARANRAGRGFCSGVYPITPSTECMEYLCLQEIEKGRVVKVESEHSAMAVCIGAASAGTVLSGLLPVIVNHITPQGKAPEGDALESVLKPLLEGMPHAEEVHRF